MAKQTRSLRSGEKEVLAQVFLKTLPFDRILITDAIGLQDRAYTMPVLLSNKFHVNVGSGAFGRDMSATEEDRALLIHECTHVWQGINGLIEWDYVIASGCSQFFALFKRGSAYDFEVGEEWKKYNVEQQAQIVEGWYLGGMSTSSNLWRYIRDDLREPGFGGQAYFFGGGRYLRWTIGEGADSGYPKEITDNWNSFVQGSQAAFNRLVGETEFYYFFKGAEYIKWKRGSGMLDGYPKPIAGNWDASFMSNGIDAALNADNNKVYFFKGDQYIRYTFGAGVDAGYPKNIGDSWGSFMANGIDAAINWGNGKAYFFKGDQYIRRTIGEGVDGGYPKETGAEWHPFMRQGLKGALLKRKDIF